MKNNKKYYNKKFQSNFSLSAVIFSSKLKIKSNKEKEAKIKRFFS